MLKHGILHCGWCEQGQVQPPLDNPNFTLIQLNRFVTPTLSSTIEMCPELQVSCANKDDAAMILHAKRCSMKEFLRITNIRSEHEYSFQDTATIFQTSPTKSSAISVSGVREAVNTARSKVA